MTELGPSTGSSPFPLNFDHRLVLAGRAQDQAVHLPHAVTPQRPLNFDGAAAMAEDHAEDGGGAGHAPGGLDDRGVVVHPHPADLSTGLYSPDELLSEVGGDAQPLIVVPGHVSPMQSLNFGRGAEEPSAPHGLDPVEGLPSQKHLGLSHLNPRQGASRVEIQAVEGLQRGGPRPVYHRGVQGLSPLRGARVQDGSGGRLVSTQSGPAARRHRRVTFAGGGQFAVVHLPAAAGGGLLGPLQRVHQILFGGPDLQSNLVHEGLEVVAALLAEGSRLGS
mmetsp:Transcript_39125/g.91137  ORF Transcript_39125/g.91137 Transcript_39125/m.91137 type:complete len:277 (+) Transcript_39125:2912-3742(+)